MPDLRERFEAADLIPVDEIWPAVRDRLDPALMDPQVHRRAEGLSGWSSSRGGWRKAATIAAALAVAVASLVVALRAFDTADRRRPGSGTTAPATVRARIPIEGNVARIVAGEGAVWILGSHGIDKLDPSTNAVVDRFGVRGAREIAAGDGALWVSTPSQVVRLDPSTGEVLARIDVPAEGPMAVGAGSLWLGQFAATGPQRILRIDQATDEIVARIIVDPEPEYLVFAGGTLWVEGTVPGVATIVRIDPSTNDVTTMFEGSPRAKFGLSYVTATTNAVWGIGCDESVLGSPTFGSKPRCSWSIVRVDAATGETEQVPFADEDVVTRSNGDLAIEAVRISLMLADRDAVWIAQHDLEPLEGDPDTEVMVTRGFSETNPRLLRIDTVTGRIVGTIPLADVPSDGVAAGGDLWFVVVGPDGSDVVVRVDPGSRR